MARPPVIPPNSLTPEELAKRILSTPKTPRKGSKVEEKASQSASG